MVDRIYDVSVSGDKAVSTFALCSTPSVDVETKLLSPSRHLIALGDTAVSFDFGEPIDVGQDVPASRGRCFWPVYVLLGNGEVYRLITSVDTHVLVYLCHYDMPTWHYGSDSSFQLYSISIIVVVYYPIIINITVYYVLEEVM